MRAPRWLVLGIAALSVFSSPAWGEQEFDDEEPAREKPKEKVQYGIGFRGRGHAIPPFALGLFYDEHPELTPREAFGFELIRRKENIDLKLSFEYANYKGSPEGDFFLNAGDNIEETEVVDNNLELFSADFSVIGNLKITSWFWFTYGAGLGAGLVRGELLRTDTFAPDPANPEVRQRCAGLQNPAANCLEVNVPEDRIPPVVPVLNMLLGMRFDLSNNVSFRVEGGLRTVSAFAGAGFDFVF